LGEARGWDWLTYHPLQIQAYHQLARAEAPAVVDALLDVFPRHQRYVDVGAGTGAFAAELIRRGRSVVACERSRTGRLYANRQGVPCVSFDLRRDPPALLDGPFELAYCFEVAEHLEPPLGDELVGFLARIAPVIVFTAAVPGQGGVGHVNEQPPKYWSRRFSAHGLRADTRLATSLSSAMARRGAQLPWFTGNIMVFCSEDAP
jgi:SAM-dependent methyltransferase